MQFLAFGPPWLGMCSYKRKRRVIWSSIHWIERPVFFLLSFYNHTIILFSIKIVFPFFFFSIISLSCPPFLRCLNTTHAHPLQNPALSNSLFISCSLFLYWTEEEREKSSSSSSSSPPLSEKITSLLFVFIWQTFLYSFSSF